jgi:hypothetical protein
MSLSKSTRKSARCAYYHQRGRDLRMASKYRDDGIDFHRYKQEYVEHLLKTEQHSDPDWARMWLAASGVGEDARDMIEWDIERFRIDPETVIGTEMFLVIDHDGKPLRGIPFPGYGKSPDDPRALAHGTLDFLHTHPVQTPEWQAIVIDDYKTGWSPYVDREEAEHYAALVFAHFPGATHVIFRWIQVRIGKIQELSFTRDQHESLVIGIHNADSRIRAIEANPDPEPNPFSGCCAWCHLECPVRGQIPVGPIQTPEDMTVAMGYITAMEQSLARAREMARAYAIEAGPTPVADGKVAQIDTSVRKEYPLRPALSALGIDIPERIEQWDLDLDKLKISTSELNRMMGTKKRAGLEDVLEPAAREKLWRELKVVEVEADAGAGTLSGPGARPDLHS